MAWLCGNTLCGLAVLIPAFYGGFWKTWCGVVTFIVLILEYVAFYFSLKYFSDLQNEKWNDVVCCFQTPVVQIGGHVATEDEELVYELQQLGLSRQVIQNFKNDGWEVQDFGEISDKKLKKMGVKDGFLLKFRRKFP